MKIPDFLKRQASALSDFQSLISEKPPAGLATLYQISSRIFKEYDRTMVSDCPGSHDGDNVGCDAGLQNTAHFDPEVVGNIDSVQHLTQDGSSLSNSNGEESPRQSRLFYFHVMSKCHVDAFILERPEAKIIFERECLHYARVCEIAITNYCVMDNHFHLNVGVPADSLIQAREKLAQMMGSIKQQFTRRFKLWYNSVYRKEIRQRKPKLGTGSLWAGPIRAEFIKDEAQLAASTLYIETNRIKVSCAEQIAALCEPPTLNAKRLCDHFGVQPEYASLLDALYNNHAQSARFYLDGGSASHHDTALTDGLDGNWASPEEVEKYWHLPSYSLPEGWRKVHYGNERRILKPTCVKQRTYHITPFIERLGKSPAVRHRNFARLVLSMCWKSRGRMTVTGAPTEQEVQGPGIACERKLDAI